MNLEQLKVLDNIVECGSLSLAAQKMYKTQPALSIAIKKLEQEFGFKILNRNNYRLSLTREGVAFYRKAQELLLNAQQLDSMGQHLGRGNEATVRFAYDLTCPPNLVTSVLKKTQAHFPDTEFRVYGESRFRGLEMLQNGKADLVISPWWPMLYGLGDLEAFTISHFKLLLVATPQFLGDEVIEQMGQLKNKVQLSVEESNLNFDSEKIVRLKGSQEWKTRDIHTLKQLLLSGLGWGYIPEILIAEELKAGKLVQLKPNDVEYEFDGEIRLIRKEDQTLGPVANFMWNEFKTFGA